MERWLPGSVPAGTPTSNFGAAPVAAASRQPVNPSVCALLCHVVKVQRTPQPSWESHVQSQGAC